MRQIKQATAYNMTVLMIDSTDHITGKAGLTLTITASKNGAAFASITPTVTDLGTGKYKLELTTSHTDTLGDLALYITGTGADPKDEFAQVVVNQDAALYQDGAVWLDTVNGVAGTTSYVNGLPTNPVTTMADAMTIAAALKLTRIHVATASSVTLASTVANYEVYGVNWTLALGSQAITGSRFIGATVSGIGTTGGAAPIFEKCVVGAVTLPPCTFMNCLHTGTITMGSAGNFLMIGSVNGKGSTAGVQITFVASGTLSGQNCSGYFQLASGAGEVFSWHGIGKLQVKATCDGIIGIVSGTMEIDNLTTTSFISDTSRWGEDQQVAHVLGKVLGGDPDGQAFQGAGTWSSDYSSGAIWIDTVGGSDAPALPYSGQAISPCLTIASALALAVSLNIKEIRVKSGSSITLAASLVGYRLTGTNWTLALGGQDISNSYISGATVSGTATGPTGQPTFENCYLTTVTLPGVYVLNSRLYGAFIMGSASSTYVLHNCIHGFPTPASDINFTFAGTSALKMHDCSGYFGFAGAASGNVLEWHGGSGRARIRDTSNALIAYLSGTIDLLDEGTASVITDDARYDTDQPVGDVQGKMLGIDFGTTITGPSVWAYDHEGNPIASGGGSPVGPGSTEVEIVTVDDESNPVDGAAVWVSTDEAGTNVIAGTLYSAGNGRVKFMLDTDMNYWVWRQISGFDFTPNPEMITLGTP